MIPDPLTFMIRLGAIVVEAYHAATVIAAEAILSAVADLADHLPGDNAEQRLSALGLACVGVLTLTTAAAVLAVVFTLGA